MKTPKYRIVSYLTSDVSVKWYAEYRYSQTDDWERVTERCITKIFDTEDDAKKYCLLQLQIIQFKPTTIYIN